MLKGVKDKKCHKNFVKDKVLGILEAILVLCRREKRWEIASKQLSLGV